MRDLRPHLVVEPGTPVRLDRLDPSDTSLVGTKEEARIGLKEDRKRIAELQQRLFAEREHALLVILQGMDTSGKDGVTRAVFCRTSPLGIAVTSFQKPSEEELAHDFLWRIHKACPRRGTIGIFNRSHYEDVLVGRVRKAAPTKVIEHRYDQINAFEDMIESSTRTLKLMLHISKDEQRKRLQSRLDTPRKRWKFDPHDLEDRELWDDFRRAYEIVLARCSTAASPWYVIPSDRKWARNAAAAAIVRATLDDMAPRFPKPDLDGGSYRIG